MALLKATHVWRVAPTAGHARDRGPLRDATTFGTTTIPTEMSVAVQQQEAETTAGQDHGRHRVANRLPFPRSETLAGAIDLKRTRTILRSS